MISSLSDAACRQILLLGRLCYFILLKYILIDYQKPHPFISTMSMPYASSISDPHASRRIGPNSSSGHVTLSRFHIWKRH